MRTVLALMVTAAVFFGTAAVQADEAPTEPAPAEPAPGEAAPGDLASALRAAMAGDFETALGRLAAIPQGPRRLWAVAMVHALQGGPQAESHLETCIRETRDAAPLQVRCVIAQARLLEGDRARLADAKAAWQRVLALAGAQEQARWTSLAESRIEAITAFQTRMEQARAVRERADQQEAPTP